MSSTVRAPLFLEGEVEALLARVQKPGRYVGGEVNLLRQPPLPGEITFALAFPDIYEVAESHTGLKILYHILNRQPGVRAERVHAPWSDMAAAMREQGVPLFSLESRQAVATFDILGFSLQYELSYPTVVWMLGLAGIPLRTAERDRAHPVVIGGGPCTCNPEPVAAFFDAFLLGDGEEAVAEIVATVRHWRQSDAPRRELLVALSRIPGVYVPSLYQVSYDGQGRVAAIRPQGEAPATVGRRVVADLDGSPYPVDPLVPFLQVVHDRIALEMQRGCTKGCRFCQAGMITRPVRQRQPETLLRLAEESLANTGYEEISFLSLSAGDYPCLEPLIAAFLEQHEGDKVSVSLPSLRVESLTQELVDRIGSVRRTGFTLAPEAATDRMRRVINKGNTEEQLLRTVRAVFEAGWKQIKLYFMVGLPTETEADLHAIPELAERVRATGRQVNRRADVTVSVSTFVPKPGTPFQWDAQLDHDEIVARQEYLREELRRRRIPFKYHYAWQSVMEGILTRGDRRLGPVIERVVAAGGWLDGWTEHFSAERWLTALEEVGLDYRFYLAPIAVEALLPWEHLVAGPRREWLVAEREAAWREEARADCTTGRCTDCGVCDHRAIRNRVVVRDEADLGGPASVRQLPGAEEHTRIRLRYAKTGRAVRFSHLETMRTLLRCLRRTGLPQVMSGGYHPKPRVGFSPACPSGVASHAEYLDAELGTRVEPGEVVERLNAVLPPGLEALEAWEIAGNAKALDASIDQVCYLLHIPEEVMDDGLIGERIAHFLEQEEYSLVRTGGGARRRRIDLRQVIHQIVSRGRGTVQVSLVHGGGPSARPAEILGTLFGLDAGDISRVVIEKESVAFR